MFNLQVVWFLYTGPTVLEVFNTLLRQLRLSVDYELTGSYDGSTNIGTKIIKAHEERQLQEAVIRTIGESLSEVSVCKTSSWTASDCLWCLCLSCLCLCLCFFQHIIIQPFLSFHMIFFSFALNLPLIYMMLIFIYFFLSISLSGSFANTLPTYQRSEVMLFIMGKIPVPGIHPTLPSTGSE